MGIDVRILLMGEWILRISRTNDVQQRMRLCPTIVIFEKPAHPSDALRVLIILLLGLFRPSDTNTTDFLDSDTHMRRLAICDNGDDDEKAKGRRSDTLSCS